MNGKIASTLAIGAGAAAVAVGGAAPALAAPEAPGLVSLHDLPGYGGESHTQLINGSGTFCLPLGPLDNRASSIRLSDARVEVFDSPGCFGAGLALPGSVPDLGLIGWDNRISSVRITVA
ncbi:hypothetical protein [Amycolatopsis magusensis]|uniref:Beta/Gamma crystallin n=1 Tax=Amycolatopsis magusensis TaxID=882444 RepID=A0ABS4Q2N1_9PSEU|nr:hypothetical protein [Amycolatopsis magusensis]MBP2185941.1 hypothetical protein [Amycolatopsis magusensis]MDI5977721.1 hypothetical protein [Amycolatopsis magusensis]